MLVLSRQRDETIMIGDDIELTVIDIRGDKVRLGINAPKTLGVHRKEVYDAIRREMRAASQVKPDAPQIDPAAVAPEAATQLQDGGEQHVIAGIRIEVWYDERACEFRAKRLPGGPVLKAATRSEAINAVLKEAKGRDDQKGAA